MWNAVANTAKAFLEHGHPRLAYATVLTITVAGVVIAAILSN